ncbi:MAG: NAD(P)H-dependent oxidoreductase, partial [Clostridia bacterium]|nr:NAD(P)H-dependent oxidoreductase [Clostridia bacterium]
MKILVLNGSPKGNYSVTLQTVLFLQNKFPSHQFEIINVGQQIRLFEKDMTKPIEAINNADLILFSYPIYTFIAPSQLHRFIELLKEHKVDLSSKFVSQITTSKHFYDITAHKYVEENVFDLSAKVIHGLSADMEDLTKKEGQEDAINFFNYLVHCVNNDLYETAPQKTAKEIPSYLANLEKVEKREGKEIVVVADILEDDDNLKNMIADFENIAPYPVKVVNIRTFPFQGGCLGCFNCAGDGKCVYQDNFDQFLREEIQTASAIVIAFSIKDHSMGARFKTYDDRQFCNGHRTVTEG